MAPDGGQTESDSPPSGGVPVRIAVPSVVPAQLEAPTPVIGHHLPTSLDASQFYGVWVVRRADARGHLAAGAETSLLQLRPDDTYAWHPAPTWSPGSGRWAVFRHEGGPIMLGLENRDGIFQAGLLVRAEVPTSDATWHWHRAVGPEAAQGARILTAEAYRA
ncbi:MAG: hypothetical protein ABI880_02880 [Acidobacteriota bacterium]